MYTTSVVHLFPFSFSQSKFTIFFFYSNLQFTISYPYAQIEKALKTKFLLGNDKTRIHMRLFIKSIYLAYCEFLCFIA